MESNQTHYFIGIKLSDEAKQELARVNIDLRENRFFKKWVNPLDYHITLAFLGNAKKDQLAKLQELLEESDLSKEEFSLHIEHFGTFGNKQSPRIFWAGLKEESSLMVLRNNVYQLCGLAGFTLETRPFHPHITVARKWIREEPFTTSIIEEGINLAQPITFKVTGIELFQTHLDRDPKYEIIKSFSFY
ncbi:MAG TPA: RNA 2',3'-cyclic phosphodiesterase [Niallia sp.]|nr:RNA 2',3'-cyclic phosphodiesterase [Niallia sp.]